MSANVNFGGFNVSFGAPAQIAVPIPTQPTSKLFEILVEGQVPSNPVVFNQGITGVPQDYLLDRSSSFMAKLVGAGCILVFFVPAVIIVPLLMFAATSSFESQMGGSVSSESHTVMTVFIVFMSVAFSLMAIALIVSAVRRPKRIVFSVEQRALLIEYGCRAPEVVGFDELDVPCINVSNNHKEPHKLHFDLRIPRLNGSGDVAIELVSLEARFKCANGVSVATEQKTRELIEIAAKICHIFRYVKSAENPISIPLKVLFNINAL